MTDDPKCRNCPHDMHRGLCGSCMCRMQRPLPDITNLPIRGALTYVDLLDDLQTKVKQIGDYDEGSPEQRTFIVTTVHRALHDVEQFIFTSYPGPNPKPDTMVSKMSKEKFFSDLGWADGT